MTMRFPPRIVEKRMQGKACEKREGWERKMGEKRQALLESKPWKNTGSLISVWRGLWKSEKKRKEKKSERTKRQGTKWKKREMKWNERKKCSVQTDMEKGIKGRSTCQSRHNLGHCKKQRSDLQWERRRQKRVISGKGQSGEKVLMTKQKIDWKTVGFFLKISKYIGKAWRKSLTRARRASLTRP